MLDAISCTGLVKRYGSFALDHVDLSVPRGQVVGVVGSNGAGKTTVIKIVLGLVRADAGDARVLGESVTAGLPRGVSARMGVVLDTCAFPPMCRVADVGAIGAAMYDAWDAGAFARLAGDAGLDAGKRVSQLSRGMGMRLSLAFALAHAPELLVLDEPTAGLDPIAREDVLDVLRAFMEGGDRAILMASHITTDLERIADEVVCMDAGRVAFALPKDDICDRAGVARCRQADVPAVAAAEDLFAGEGPLVRRRGYSVDVLVPDRVAFARRFPDVACDAASIEEYMALTLRGERA